MGRLLFVQSALVVYIVDFLLIKIYSYHRRMLLAEE